MLNNHLKTGELNIDGFSCYLFTPTLTPVKREGTFQKVSDLLKRDCIEPVPVSVGKQPAGRAISPFAR